jgi:hypothetical protein
MSRSVYIVILSREKWYVDLEGKAVGPFTSKAMAQLEAVSMARFLSHTGKKCEVRVPNDAGKYLIEWESEPYKFAGPSPKFPPRAGNEQRMQPGPR